MIIDSWVAAAATKFLRLNNSKGVKVKLERLNKKKDNKS